MSGVTLLLSPSATSRLPSASLASPPDSSASRSIALADTRFDAFSLRMAFFKIAIISDLLSGSSTSTRERESNGVMISKLGFSVVAPINVMRPDSTCGKNASCWALLNRWISSTNKIVRSFRFQFCLACSTTCNTSFLPAVTALISTNSASSSRASMRASVVLPVPGGPQSIRLVGCLVSMMRRNKPLSPAI